jgi:hypothetical protein
MIQPARRPVASVRTGLISGRSRAGFSAVVDRKGITSFAETACRLLDTLPVHVAVPQIIMRLRPILLDPKTADIIIQDNNRHVLFEKPGGLAEGDGLTILGHHHPTSTSSPPHDHGRTWAIYGVVTGKTSMYEYTPILGHDQAVRLTNSYWIMPGQVGFYPRGVIHSHWTHDDSRLIRIEGLNIWRRANKIGGRNYRLEEG